MRSRIGMHLIVDFLRSRKLAQGFADAPNFVHNGGSFRFGHILKMKVMFLRHDVHLAEQPPLTGIFRRNPDIFRLCDVTLPVGCRFIVTHRTKCFLRGFNKFGVAVMKASAALLGRSRPFHFASGEAVMYNRFFFSKTVFSIQCPRRRTLRAIVRESNNCNIVICIKLSQGGFKQAASCAFAAILLRHCKPCEAVFHTRKTDKSHVIAAHIVHSG
jgi:hypothetical protein